MKATTAFWLIGVLLLLVVGVRFAVNDNGVRVVTACNVGATCTAVSNLKAVPERFQAVQVFPVQPRPYEYEDPSSHYSVPNGTRVLVLGGGEGWAKVRIVEYGDHYGAVGYLPMRETELKP
jgi:hypothetical protein